VLKNVHGLPKNCPVYDTFRLTQADDHFEKFTMGLVVYRSNVGLHEFLATPESNVQAIPVFMIFVSTIY
jgi:hypothetical protein